MRTRRALPGGRRRTRLGPARAGRRPAPRVVVIGGGFAGASCARALQRAAWRVTLVEPSATYTACPFSNAVIAGLAAARGAAVRLRGRCGAQASRSRAKPRRLSMLTPSGCGSPTEPPCPTTGWCWRPASTFASTPCPATTRRRPSCCRTPGRRASRQPCCAASSRRWTTAARSSSRCPPTPTAARPARTSGRA